MLTVASISSWNPSYLLSDLHQICMWHAMHWLILGLKRHMGILLWNAPPCLTFPMRRVGFFSLAELEAISGGTPGSNCSKAYRALVLLLHSFESFGAWSIKKSGWPRYDRAEFLSTGIHQEILTGSCIIYYLFEFENLCLRMFVVVEMWCTVTHKNGPPSAPGRSFCLKDLLDGFLKVKVPKSSPRHPPSCLT